MSTWTSRALAALLLLPGCLAAPGPVAGPGSGGVAVAAPAGFCAAPAARVGVAGGDFVGFAPCNGAAAPILTATVGAPESAVGLDLSGRTLAAFFTSPTGRASLSRTGDPASVQVLEVLEGDGTVLVRLADRSPGQGGLPPGEAWRALLVAEGRLVTLTVAGAGEGREPGLRLINRFLTAFAAANRG